MGKYSVPENIRKLKPQGTMVKKINNGFYVYNYSSKQVWVTDIDGNKRWKTKTTMRECIGLISETDGFISKTNLKMPVFQTSIRRTYLLSSDGCRKS